MQKEDLNYLWSRWLEQNKNKPIFNGYYSGAQSFFSFIENYLGVLATLEEPPEYFTEDTLR